MLYVWPNHQNDKYVSLLQNVDMMMVYCFDRYIQSNHRFIGIWSMNSSLYLSVESVTVTDFPSSVSIFNVSLGHLIALNYC